MSQERQPLWYLFLLLKNRWFLIKALLVVMIPTIVITYLMKEKFTVTTVIMPPEEQSSPGLTIAGLGLAEFAGYFGGGMGFSLPLMTTLSDVYDEILRSRTLVETVIMKSAYIDSMNLRDTYDNNHQLGLYWARKKFLTNYQVGVSPTGFINIKFTAGDPMYAVHVSEQIVAALDSINRAISTSRLQQARIFLEQRVEMADSSLDEAEQALRDFEEKYDMVAPEEEMSGYISNLADLKIQYANLMTEIEAMQQGISGAPSATLIFKERRAAELLDVINMLESGRPAPGYEDIIPSIGMQDYPDVALEYAVLKADYEMYLQVSSAVKISLQEAIAAEERQQTHLRVLDPPEHPGWKSRPKKSLIWMEVFLLAFLSLFCYIVARENIRRLKKEAPEKWEPWDKLLSEIKREVTFGRKK
jgi:uncharacterized protein involved in exopolysaccharide biosynthesis